MPTYAQTLRLYLQEGKIEEALSHILDTLTASGKPYSDLLNMATMQKGTLSRISRDFHKGLITSEQYNIGIAKVNNAVLYIIDEVEKKGIEGHIPALRVDSVPPLPVKDTKIKILFLGANPMDATRLRIAEELRDIDTGLRMAAERDRIVLAQRWAVTTEVLQQAMLDETPTIIHFSGHGTEEGIMLENREGRSQLVSESALAGLFTLFSDSIRCVVLNSCFSLGQAQAISVSIPFVVGMKSSMPDEAAIAFSLGFYRAIGAGREVPFAFDLGVNAIKLAGYAGADLPVLLCKATDGSSPKAH